MADTVKLEDVTKTFDNGSTIAVNDISIEIPSGSFTTIVGPSGCGKTTTLRMISGLEKPTSGKIFFGDKDVTDLSPQDRNIAMVFQNIALYPHMSVRDNIGYGLKVKGVNKDKRDELVEEAAEVLQITDQLDKKPSQLSGGQQQRVGLGSVFVEDPDVLLLDEPMSDLDAKLKAELRVEVQRLHQELDATLIYVTHDQTEAMTMSDYILLMDNGNIAQFGTPDDLFHSPNSEYVARFIGTPSTNILECNISESNGQRYISDDHFSIPVQISDDRLVPGEKINLGIRPQYLSLNANSENSFPVIVDVIEMLGTNHVIHAERNDGTKIDIITDSPKELNPGDEITVGFNSEDIYLFHEGISKSFDSDSPVRNQNEEDTEQDSRTTG